MRKRWIVLIIVIITGAAITAICLSIGAKADIFVDSKGIHYSDKMVSEIVSDKAAETFSNIEIRAASANIEFIIAENYGFEFSKNNAETASYSNENGKLTITKKNKIRLFNFYSTQNDFVKIYLPENATMGTVIIKNPSGNLIINKLECGNLNIKSTSGNTTIHNIASPIITIDKSSGNVDMTNCKADKFDLTLTSGNLKANNIESGALNVKQTSGDAAIDGKLSGENTISMSSGNITLRITGNKNDYNRNISVVSGNVYIDGTKTKNGHFANTDAKNSISVETTSGNISIDFLS